MASISTSEFLGSVLTAIQLLAGLCGNHFAYSELNSWKYCISERKTYVLQVRDRSKLGKIQTRRVVIVPSTHLEL
jgi:hypothetical protein